jgi:hypothetical protein
MNTTVLQRNFEFESDPLKRNVFPVTREQIPSHCHHRRRRRRHYNPQSWPPSKFPPPLPLHGCCPPATCSQHLQILPTSSLHLARRLPTFIIVLQVAGTSVSQAYRSLPFLLHDQPTHAWQFSLPQTDHAVVSNMFRTTQVVMRKTSVS